MKEAAGEANMTVITIVLIAVVLAVGTIIVRNVMTSNQKSSCCAANGGVWFAGACYKPNQCTTGTSGTTCTGTGSVSTNCG